jgi:fucose permease
MTREVAIAAAIAGVGAIFTAGVNLAIFDRMMAIVPKGYGITFTSVDTSLVYLAGITGPLLAALLADRLGLANALIVASGATVVGAVLFAVERFGPAKASVAAGAVSAGATGAVSAGAAAVIVRPDLKPGGSPPQPRA